MRANPYARLAAVAALTLRTISVAADPAPTEIALARRLFSEARTAEDAKDWALATSKLRDAISMKETPGLRFHLAYCEEQQGMLVEALVDYERADDLSADMNEEFRSQIPARKTALQRRIPTVTLLYAGDLASARLTVDGRTLASSSLGKPIPQNPGKHGFKVSSPGFVPFELSVSLSEGDAVVTNVVLASESNGRSTAPAKNDTAAAAEDAVSRRASTRGWPTRTYVLLGEGALTLGALAAGLVFTLQASSDDERASDARANLPGRSEQEKSAACLPPQQTPAECEKLGGATNDASRHRSNAQLAFIGTGIGAAALVGTVLLWPSARSQTALRPWLGAEVAGLSLAGRF
jgi:hypothetical protein